MKFKAYTDTEYMCGHHRIGLGASLKWLYLPSNLPIKTVSGNFNKSPEKEPTITYYLSLLARLLSLFATKAGLDSINKFKVS